MPSHEIRTAHSITPAPPRPRVHFAPILEASTLVRDRVRAALPAPGARTELIYVHGPAGMGKSTALAQWVRSQGRDAPPTVWISMHDDDHDRTQFWARVITAVQESGEADSSERFARFETTALVQAGMRSTLIRLFESLTRRVHIVIDDFHLVEEQAIDDDILAVLSSAAEVGFIIVSRARSPLGSILTSLRVPTTVIDARDFAFTLDETRALLELRFGTDAGAQAATVHEQSGGWPLATRALVLARTASVPMSSVHRTRQAHARFVAECIAVLLARLDDDERRLLLQTSFCADFTVPFAASVGGMARARVAAVVREWESLGVTTQRPGRTGAVYEHHPYLREEIRRTAEVDLNAEQIAAVRRAYARHVEFDRPDLAFRILCDLGDLHTANALLTRTYPILISVHASAAAAALRPIPVEQLAAYPVLLSALWNRAYSNPAAQRAWIENWYEHLLSSVAARVHDERELPPQETAVLTGMHRLMGRAAEAGRLADVVMSQLGDPAGTAPHEDLGRSLPMVFAVVALTKLLLGEYIGADHGYALCGAVATHEDERLEIFRAHNGQAMAAAVGGDIRYAQQKIADAEGFEVLADWEDHFGGTNLRIARAWVALESFDAAAALDEVRALQPYEKSIETWPLIALAESRGVLYEAGAHEAETVLRSAIARHTNRPGPLPAMAAQLTALQATLAMYRGDSRGARSILNRADPLRPESTIVRAQLALVNGDAAEALTHAISIVHQDHGQSRAAHRVHVEATLIAAAAHQKLGFTTTAGTLARTAFADLATRRLVTPLLVLPRADLDELIADAAIALDDAWARTLRGLPDLFAGHSASEPLSEKEIQVLTQIARDKTVSRCAASLYVSPNTVKHHLKNIYRKLGVGSRREALDHAMARGLIRMGSTAVEREPRGAGA